MQNRYVGDVGDFVKLGILRALGGGLQVGVAWWLHPDEAHNGDGRHVDYLQRPTPWRALDPELFDALHAVVASGRRSVSALEGADLLAHAVYCREAVPTDGPSRTRAAERARWFEQVRTSLAGCDLVFVDPDNGLETKRYSPSARRAAKCVSLAEIRALAHPGRTIVVYHHHTRRRGGHEAELAYWGGRLAEAGFGRVDALRARSFSPRAFFILDASDLVRDRARSVAALWRGVLTWWPDLQDGLPCSPAEAARRADAL